MPSSNVLPNPEIEPRSPTLQAQSCLATPWTVACQAPLSMGFSRQEHEWVAISYSGDLPHPGTEPASLVSLALLGRIFTTEPPGKPLLY